MSALTRRRARSVPATRRRVLSRDEVWIRVGIGLVALWLMVSVALPLWSLLSKSFEDDRGRFVGLANYIAYFQNPTLVASVVNSLSISLAATLIVLPLAYVYAYALTRSCMPAKGLFHAVALLPIFAPSLLPAISFIYLFGNQGLLKGLLFGREIYGALGILLAQIIYTFPHALTILIAALALSDARLYEAAAALGTSKARLFATITLPSSRYGLVSAAFVVFTLVITDFGVPKVIGGQFNVLATDVYKQVMGQQNFQMGAVVGFLLLTPAVLAFGVQRLVQRRQVALLSARAVPLEPRPNRARDRGLLAFCAVTGGLILGVIGVSVWASFITYWPYNLTPTLGNYAFENFDASGWAPFVNSLKVASLTAIFGTVVVFIGAYAIEKAPGFRFGKAAAQFLAMLPMAVPGLVLGLGYIFFFNAVWNPLNFLYGTIAILVINCIAHFYTVAHVTATTALKQIDPEFEAVSASLKVPMWRTFLRVTVPISSPAILDVGVYLFVNAMTTVSAIIFIYGPDTKLASVAIINMDEAGATAAAAAMATLIVLTSIGAKLAQLLAARLLASRWQAWRKR
jgi:iron(III) transport system permease protein